MTMSLRIPYLHVAFTQHSHDRLTVGATVSLQTFLLLSRLSWNKTGISPWTYKRKVQHLLSVFDLWLNQLSVCQWKAVWTFKIEQTVAPYWAAVWLNLNFSCFACVY